MVLPLQAATFSVTNTNDAGLGSLRQAVVDANANSGADDIRFDGVSGILLLASGQLTVTDDLTIDGPGRDVLSIDANGTSRIFFLAARALTVRGLMLTGGNPSDGGVKLESWWYYNPSVTMRNSTISGNRKLRRWNSPCRSVWRPVHRPDNSPRIFHGNWE